MKRRIAHMVLVWIVGMLFCVPTLHAQIFSSQMPSTTFRSTSTMVGSGSVYASAPTAYAPGRMPSVAPIMSSRPRRGDDWDGWDDGDGPSLPPHPGVCEHCVDLNGDTRCDYCGHSITSCDCDGCRCPAGDAVVPLLLAAFLFVIKKKFQRRFFSR